MKLYLDRKRHFDYKHCLEMIKEQLDFLYKQNKISMIDYVSKKDRINLFLENNNENYITISDLIKLRKNEPILEVKNHALFYSQIAKGTQISTNLYSGEMTRKLIIEKEFYFEINNRFFVKLNEITKIGY